MDDLGQRDELALGVRPLPEIGDRPLVDGGRHVRVAGCDGDDGRTVVGDVVHRRHVDARHLGELVQDRLAVGAPAADPRPDDLGDLADDLLALAEHDDVDEVGERLGVERGVPADDDERVLRPPVSRSHRHARKVDHVEEVGEHQLRGEVERQQVELARGAVGVDREQRYASRRSSVARSRHGAYVRSATASSRSLRIS